MTWRQSSILSSITTTIIVGVYFIYILPLQQQLEHEKAINAYAVSQFNKMSTKAKKLQDRVEELESANEAMMFHCTPSSVMRAIKATPLPTLEV